MVYAKQLKGIDNKKFETATKEDKKRDRKLIPVK
jgi:hypothetical protein